MGIKMEQFLTMYPLALAPVVLWTVWRIHKLENEIMMRIREDIAEIKNDIKWLVKTQEEHD